MFAFGFEACECFARALRDKVAFNLSREGESECQHFALDIIAETITVLHRPDAAAAFHAQTENLHDHEQTAPEAAEFAADDEVASPDASQECAEAALAVRTGAGDGLLDPSVDG